MSKPTTTNNHLRIGQVAERTGLSRKALRLYEARGLLEPDAHSGAGYRLYGRPALARLAEIEVLKRAGFSLVEIRKLLEHEAPAAKLVEARIVSLRHEVQARSRALFALEQAWRGLSATSQTIDQLLENIQMNEHLDVHLSEAEKAEYKRHGEILGRHFTPEERELMRRRHEELGDTRVQQANAAWPALISEVRAAMDAGTSATDPTVIGLARRWHGLVRESTGGDARIGRAIKAAFIKEPEIMAAQGMDTGMFTYVHEAMEAAGLKLSG